MINSFRVRTPSPVTCWACLPQTEVIIPSSAPGNFAQWTPNSTPGSSSSDLPHQHLLSGTPQSEPVHSLPQRSPESLPCSPSQDHSLSSRDYIPPTGSLHAVEEHDKPTTPRPAGRPPTPAKIHTFAIVATLPTTSVSSSTSSPTQFNPGSFWQTDKIRLLGKIVPRDSLPHHNMGTAPGLSVAPTHSHRVGAGLASGGSVILLTSRPLPKYPFPMRPDFFETIRRRSHGHGGNITNELPPVPVPALLAFG